MTKKKIRRKANYADFGADFKAGKYGDTISAAGTLGGGLLSNGMQTTAGGILSGLGSVASAIPGPWGAVAGAGLNLVGGLVNAAFGSKINQEAVNKFENENQAQSNLQFDDSSTESLLSQSNFNTLGSIQKSQVGKDGWFSNKAKNLTKRLNAERKLANAQAIGNFSTAVDNLDSRNDQLALANYSAFGGPILGGGAIAYDLANKQLYTQALNALSKNKITAMPNSFAPISTFATGGTLGSNGADWTNGLIFINEGGTHEASPYEGVQVGVDNEGVPNLVEEGEVIWDDYVFSNRLHVPRAVKEKYKLKDKKLTFAEVAKILQKESEERPNDEISRRGLTSFMGELMMYQEDMRSKKRLKHTNKRLFAKGGPKGINPDRQDEEEEVEKEEVVIVPTGTKVANPHATEHTGSAPASTNDEGDTTGSGKRNALTAFRYAPAVGSGLAVLSDIFGWTNKADYSNSDLIGNAVDNLSRVSFTPVNNYLTYNPLDREFYLNKLRAQQAATRRSIVNNSGGNRATALAGLLASDYNYGINLGEFARQAEEQNFARKQAVATFNRATDMFNSEGFMKADVANQSRDKLRLQAAMAEAEMREQIGARVDAAKSANMTNFLTNLGNIGREEVMKSWINENPALYYAVSTGGAGISYKGNIIKNGGYLTRKRRK